MRFTDSYETMFGTANGICVEFDVVAFVGCCFRCGFRRGDCLCTGWADGIGGTVDRMLFLVCLMWVRGLVPRVRVFIGFVDVVTGGAVATLWSGYLPSEMGVESTLWFDWACISVAIYPITVTMLFRRLALASGFMLWIESMSSSYTSYFCSSGVNSGNRYCCGNKSNDPENMSPFVLGMNHRNTL